MIRVLSILALASFASCGELCNSSATCIGPPEGNFVDGKVNLAFYEVVSERLSDGSNEVALTLDSVIVNSMEARVISQFYSWSSLEQSDLITSIDLYSGETIISIPEEDFIFLEGSPEFTEGGYLLWFNKQDEAYSTIISPVTQDFIDGICNDVITDC